jgi:hypothetical protein
MEMEIDYRGRKISACLLVTSAPALVLYLVSMGICLGR